MAIDEIIDMVAFSFTTATYIIQFGDARSALVEDGRTLGLPVAVVDPGMAPASWAECGARGRADGRRPEIVARHAARIESLLEDATAPTALDLIDSADRGTASSTVSTIKPVTPSSSTSGTDPRRHPITSVLQAVGLDHGQPEGLGPVDGEQQGTRPGQQLLLFAVTQLAQVVDERQTYQAEGR